MLTRLLRFEQEILLTSKAVRSHSSSLPVPLERLLFNSVSLREPPKLLVLKHLGVVQDPEVQAATGEITRQAIVSDPGIQAIESIDSDLNLIGSPARFRHCSGLRSNCRSSFKFAQRQAGGHGIRFGLGIFGGHCPAFSPSRRAPLVRRNLSKEPTGRRGSSSCWC